MSAGNTPSRHHGMAVPGIDTRGAFHTHQQAPNGMPNSSWPMTPPQAVMELRRPSLAYSSVSDASTSGPSSICDYSQPATPVHSLGHSNDSFAQHSWNADSVMTATAPDQCSMGHQPMYNPALAHAMPAVDMTSYSPARHQNISAAFGSHNQSPMRDVWSHANHSGLGLDSSLRTTLFQTTQALGHEAIPRASSSMYANPSSSMHHAALEQSAFQDFNNVAAPMYPAAQVVVPSQVNQEDYAMDQCSGYDANDLESEDFSRSFDSSTTAYSGWDAVGSQSPEDAYYAPSEDEDYIMVKDEASGTPGPRSYIHGRTSDRKRVTKRPRKTPVNSRVLAEHVSYGCIVRYEGKEFVRDDNGNAVAANPDGFKAQTCTWVDELGKCNAKFTRSEHLKRHMTKHQEEKPFPCPLAGCDKKMSRPDNAGDHFKTHLKEHVKGKRNKQCTLPELTAAMHDDERWDEKKRTKMLNNLIKWHAEYYADVNCKKRLADAHGSHMHSHRMSKM